MDYFSSLSMEVADNSSDTTPKMQFEKVKTAPQIVTEIFSVLFFDKVLVTFVTFPILFFCYISSNSKAKYFKVKKESTFTTT